MPHCFLINNFPSPQDLDSIKERQKVRDLVMEGKIQKASVAILEIIPNQHNLNTDKIMFLLQSRQFVELVASLSSSMEVKDDS